MGKMKKIIKYTISNIINCYANIVYYIIYYFSKKELITVKTIDDTINDLLSNNNSIIRFGDADINLIEGESQKYQEYSIQLKERLVECANSNYEGLMVAIPDIFNGLHEMKTSARRYWFKHLLTKRKTWNKIFPNKIYYNSFVTRLYIDYNIEYCIIAKRFNNIKKIWNNKDIVIVEGIQSRLGVGNDLFDNAKTIRRILCPNKNAFKNYNEILNEVLSLNHDALIIVALGPTARPLVLDLFLNGFRSIDIGHIDIEYEWFLKKVKIKTKINNKYVNEIANYNVEDCNDVNYLKQVIKKIN